MKSKSINTLCFTLTIISLLGLCTNAQSQVKTETIQINESVSKGGQPVLVLLNISGDIRIKESMSNAFVGTVRMEDYEKGKSTRVELVKEMKGDTLFLYGKFPCPEMIKRTPKHGWSYDWEQDCNNREPIKTRLDYELTVPKGTELNLSTINDGDVVVASSSGKVWANNINGSIKLQDLSGSSTMASTINGDVHITYLKNPTEPCRFYTLNGEITTYFKPNLNAKSSFKSFQGDFFTDIDDISIVAADKKKLRESEDGLLFEIDSRRQMQMGIGSNQLILEFETFNGNAYLKIRK